MTLSAARPTAVRCLRSRAWRSHLETQHNHRNGTMRGFWKRARYVSAILCRISQLVWFWEYKILHFSKKFGDYEVVSSAKVSPIREVPSGKLFSEDFCHTERNCPFPSGV